MQLARLEDDAHVGVRVLLGRLVEDGEEVREEELVREDVDRQVRAAGGRGESVSEAREEEGERDALEAVVGERELVDADTGNAEEPIEAVERPSELLGDARDRLEVLEVDDARADLAALLAAVARVVGPGPEDPAKAVLVVLRRAAQLARLDVGDGGVGRLLLRAEDGDVGAVRVQGARDAEADAVGAYEQGARVSSSW